MLSLPSRTKMYLCMNPVDMRKSFDGLFGIVREEFRQDPLSGHLFLFVNKRRLPAVVEFSPWRFFVLHERAVCGPRGLDAHPCGSCGCDQACPLLPQTRTAGD